MMCKFCPTCIVELQEEKRKLGRGNKKWLVCPSCGFRMRSHDPQPDNHLIDESNRTNTLEDEENNDYR